MLKVVCVMCLWHSVPVQQMTGQLRLLPASQGCEGSVGRHLTAAIGTPNVQTCTHTNKDLRSGLASDNVQTGGVALHSLAIRNGAKGAESYHVLCLRVRPCQRQCAGSHARPKVATDYLAA